MNKNIIIIIESITIVILLALVSIIFFKNTNLEGNNLEIEKKWLINLEEMPYDLSIADKYEIVQTYFSFNPEMRVRNINKGEFYVLTIKRDTELKGFVREEYEYIITEEEYNNLLNKKEGDTIYKTRYQIEDENGFMMAIDVFDGYLKGLAYLEIEFENKEIAESYEIPNWAIKDVTTDLEYKNGHLSRYGIPNSFYEYIKNE